MRSDGTLSSSGARPRVLQQKQCVWRGRLCVERRTIKTRVNPVIHRLFQLSRPHCFTGVERGNSAILVDAEDTQRHLPPCCTSATTHQNFLAFDSAIEACCGRSDEGGKEALGGGWCGFAEEAAAGRGHVAPEYMLQALFSFTNSTGCHSTAINRSGIAQLKHESRANVLCFGSIGAALRRCCWRHPT